MTRSLIEDLQWAAGLVADAVSIGRNRRQAEEVAALAARQPGGDAGILRTRRLAETLGAIRDQLLLLIADESTAEPPPKDYRITWGTTAPDPPIGEMHPERRDEAYGERQGPPLETAPALPPPAAVAAATELCDWLDRVREDERISHDGAVRGAIHKSNAVLSALGIEKIDRKGPFDSRDQQIVDCVGTDSPEAHMQICSTVQCGYRLQEQLIRPQRVLVYRCAEMSGLFETG